MRHALNFIRITVAVSLVILASASIQANTHQILKLENISKPTNIDSYLTELSTIQSEGVPEALSQLEHDLIKRDGLKENAGSDAKWYLLTIEAPINSPNQWYVSTALIQAPLLQAVSISAGKITSLIDTDEHASFAERPTLNRVLTIPLNTPSGEITQVYFRYRSIAKFPLYPVILDEDMRQQRSSRYELMNGMAMGSVLVLLLFFFTQYIVKPSKVLGIYCLLVASVGLFITQITGYNFQYLWPNGGVLNSKVTSAVAGITYIFYFLFTLTLFELKTRHRFLFHALRIVTLITAMFIILSLFIDVSLSMAFFALVSLPLPVVAGICFFSKEKFYSVFFLLGAIIHCSSAMLFSLTITGIDFGLYRSVFAVVGLGQLLDIALFAAALIYQSKKTQDDLNHHLKLKLKDAELLAQSEKEKSMTLAKLQDYNLQLAAVTHDLTQPLTSIKMVLSVVDEKESGAAKTKMQDTLHYAEQILQSLLKTTKNEYMEIHESLDIRRLITAVRSRHESHIIDKGLKFRSFSSIDVLTCSPLIIHRILDNLISNASHHTQKGGILLSVRRRKYHTLIELWDTGCGIPTAQLSEISLPYSQIKSDVGKKRGIGMGLYIVKALCESAGYLLTVHSREDKGSRFSINIPHH